MAKVKDVITWLSERDPEETIALSGWWYKSDVENNNDIKLTDNQWQFIADRHEENTEVHIDSFVSEALEEEEDLDRCRLGCVCSDEEKEEEKN